jgi:hypothetical protein
VHYFLGDRTDTRSSYYLEDAATEFQVQGLELDWTCVTWDADLRFTGSGWSFHDFRGDRWCKHQQHRQPSLPRNAYRVLSHSRPTRNGDLSSRPATPPIRLVQPRSTIRLLAICWSWEYRN